MAQPGILAIWNNVAPGREADFETWFQGEHLQERLGVPGFIYGRRHQAISGGSAFFNFYLVESPAVLTSKPYLERLDNPTPMTRMIMTEVFRDMNRTLCHRAVRRGDFRGAYAVTVRWFDETPNVANLTSSKSSPPTRRSPRARSGPRPIPPASRCRWRRSCAAAIARSEAR